MFILNASRGALSIVHVIFTFCLSVVSCHGTNQTLPAAREDVIGQYLLINEKQCHRLCWYHNSCSSYSFNTKLNTTSDDTATHYNCMLHTDSVQTTAVISTTTSDSWVEKPVSGSSINNGCKARPCNNREICIPTSSTSESPVCLPLQCGIPEAVPHGNVSVNGTRPGDVAYVTCDQSYVASPKGVSMEMVCLVTPSWTPFGGTCQQYEFVMTTTTDIPKYYTLPWKMEPKSSFCVKGVFDLSSYVQFRSSELRIAINYRPLEQNNSLYWNVLDDGRWTGRVILDTNPVLRGGRFSMTIRLLSETLQLVLNEARTYNIPLADVKDNGGRRIDFNQFHTVRTKGVWNYVNLIAGCSIQTAEN